MHVACFDTGFHADLPDVSRRLPVAAELAARGVRRYGFHGLSMQSVLLARPDLGQAVVAHLGSGCSVTAVGRRPVAAHDDVADPDRRHDVGDPQPATSTPRSCST